MPLAVATLEELDKLQGLKARGVILKRQYEVIKKHIMEGNSLTNKNWKAFELAWKLKTNGGFSEEEWTTQIDGDISVIVNSARPSLSSQHASTPSALGKRPAAAAAAAAAVRGAPNRGNNKKTEAAQGSRNIINAFAFGSGKRILRTHAGVEEHVSSVSFAPSATEPRLPCHHCSMTFENEQGRAVHEKIKHSTVNMMQGVRLQRMLGKDTKGVLPWERAGPGRCWHVKVDGTTGVASFILQRKPRLHLDLDSDSFTATAVKAKKTRGAAQRKRYDFRFKAHATNQLRILEEDAEGLWKEEHLTPQQYLEAFLGVDHSLLSKWVTDEDNIVRLAADDVTKTLLGKQQPKRWFPAAEKRLCNLFMERRKRKLKVSTLWLTVRFRKLLAEMYPSDERAAAFRGSFRWMRKWAKRHNLSKRRRTNLKNKSVEERVRTWYIERTEDFLRPGPHHAARPHGAWGTIAQSGP